MKKVGKSGETSKRNWLRLTVKILIGIIITIILLLGGASLYFYYKGNELLRDYLVKTVERSSKGIYHLELEKLSVNLFNGRINLKGFHLKPDTALYNKRSQTDTLSPMLIDAKINNFQVRGLTLQDILISRKIDISKILVNAPEITIILKRTTPKAEKHASNPKMLSIPLPKGMESIQVELIKLENGKLMVDDQTKQPPQQFKVPSFDITFTNLLIDSTHTGMRRILNTDDIKIALKGMELKTKNGMYTIIPGSITLSTGASNIVLSNMKIIPNYNRFDFSRKLGYQMDRMDISIKQLELKGIDLRQLLINRRFIVNKVLVDGLVLEDYRDKRVANRPNFKPPLLHRALVDAKGYLKIDTVQLTNGRVTYSEQVGNQPGTIFFDKMEGTIYNITNDSMLIKQKKIMNVHAQMYLMGKGKLDAQLFIPLGDPKDAFTFSGVMTDMDLTLINPMVSAMVPAEVTSGLIKKMVFTDVQANNISAVGKLDLYYNNLQVKVTQKDEKAWTKLKTGLATVAGNTFVRNDNPTPGGKFTEGIIYFERDVHKSLFNFLWKSIFSGIKSTIGINKKEQKEIKKAEKKKE